MVKGNVTALLVIGFVTGMLVSRFIGSYTRHKDVRDAIFRAEQAEIALLLLEESCEWIGEDDE